MLFVGGGLVGLARVRPELVDRLWQRLTVPESPRRPDAADPEAGELAEGWVRVHVGGPSGAPELPEPSGNDSDAGFPDFVLVVQPGQTLRGIAAEHYRRSDVRLLEALARYNDMDNPNDLPAGAELRLPDIEAFEGL